MLYNCRERFIYAREPSINRSVRSNRVNDTSRYSRTSLNAGREVRERGHIRSAPSIIYNELKKPRPEVCSSSCPSTNLHTGILSRRGVFLLDWGTKFQIKPRSSFLPLCISPGLLFIPISMTFFFFSRERDFIVSKAPPPTL